MHYYAIIIILDENGLRSTILSFIAIISWTIYRPAKFVIVTGLYSTVICKYFYFLRFFFIDFLEVTTYRAPKKHVHKKLFCALEKLFTCVWEF